MEIVKLKLKDLTPYPENTAPYPENTAPYPENTAEHPAKQLEQATKRVAGIYWEISPREKEIVRMLSK